LHVVGKEMPRAIRGETSILEHLMHDGLLNDYYATALGLGQVTDRLADTTAQIARRYPGMKILEIGAGTGGATRQILNRIGHDFANYTFTDISSGFFGNAQTEFAPYSDQMSFAILDLEQDVQNQGFEQHSYDLIIASLVVHATKNLEQSMRRVRSLLKPGGYVILSELTNIEVTRGTFIFGCLPGWWLGQDEGRTLSPAVNESKWDAILRKTGFSGVDIMTPTQDSLPFANSVLVSHLRTRF
jgi:hybrid polyketide synthase/nonribosomal peptide synthetase ACE1